MDTVGTVPASFSWQLELVLFFLTEKKRTGSKKRLYAKEKRQLGGAVSFEIGGYCAIWSWSLLRAPAFCRLNRMTAEISAPPAVETRKGTM